MTGINKTAPEIHHGLTSAFQKLSDEVILANRRGNNRTLVLKINKNCLYNEKTSLLHLPYRYYSVSRM